MMKPLMQSFFRFYYIDFLVANGYQWNGAAEGNKIAKSMAAAADWDPYLFTGAVGNDVTLNNASGFSALPSGFRNNNGSFMYRGYADYWWVATEYGSQGAYYRYIAGSYADIVKYNTNKGPGFSIRLLRD